MTQSSLSFPPLSTERESEPMAMGDFDMRQVATVILSGGQGTRLYPLTETRCKPAIALGGSYRLIDVALSNAIHSGCRKIFVVTQFLSSSLHKHIGTTYQGHSVFAHGFIDLLPAEQRPSSSDWFEGTADAVRKNLFYLEEVGADYFLILSGDQLYRMNFQRLIASARTSGADVTIAALPVGREDASRMGVLALDRRGKVSQFLEKPQQPDLLAPFSMRAETRLQLGLAAEDERCYLASMGIYLFRREALLRFLAADRREDFGKHLLPTAIEEGNCYGYLYDGYWEDVGTIGAFYRVNMELTQPRPLFNCYDEEWPLLQAPIDLPGAKCYQAELNHSILCQGAFVERASLSHTILGPRACVLKGCEISDSYIMGHDFYVPPGRSKARYPEKLQISEGCVIKRAIIDKEAYLGKGVRLTNERGLESYDGDQVFIRDGVIIVARGASLPDGYVL